MKTEVKKIDGTKRSISVEVAGDIVKNKFEEVFKKIGQEAKISGFRPGHAPRDLIEKNYSSTANELVLKDLIPDLYNKAIDKEALDVIDMPNISGVKLDGNNLSFMAEVEVRPEINLNKYKGVKINYKKIEVSPDDIKRHIDSLKEARKIDNIDDIFAKSLGYPSLPELEKSIEAQLFIQKQNQARKTIEEKLITDILKDLDFKAPQVLVNRQLEELKRQVKLDLVLKGVPKEKIEEQEDILSKDLSEEAKKQIKVYLVLSEIAKKENIPQDDHVSQKVIEFLFREADWVAA
jgi:FKBP-type peptidyl-prolyl cis-trans isomerase (trigger factor)